MQRRYMSMNSLLCNDQIDPKMTRSCMPNTDESTVHVGQNLTTNKLLKGYLNSMNDFSSILRYNSERKMYQDRPQYRRSSTRVEIDNTIERSAQHTTKLTYQVPMFTSNHRSLPYERNFLPKHVRAPVRHLQYTPNFEEQESSDDSGQKTPVNSDHPQTFQFQNTEGLIHAPLKFNNDFHISELRDQKRNTSVKSELQVNRECTRQLVDDPTNTNSTDTHATFIEFDTSQLSDQEHNKVISPGLTNLSSQLPTKSSTRSAYETRVQLQRFCSASPCFSIQDPLASPNSTLTRSLHEGGRSPISPIPVTNFRRHSFLSTTGYSPIGQRRPNSTVFTGQLSTLSSVNTAASDTDSVSSFSSMNDSTSTCPNSSLMNQSMYMSPTPTHHSFDDPVILDASTFHSNRQGLSISTPPPTPTSSATSYTPVDMTRSVSAIDQWISGHQSSRPRPVSQVAPVPRGGGISHSNRSSLSWVKGRREVTPTTDEEGETNDFEHGRRQDTLMRRRRAVGYCHQPDNSSLKPMARYAQPSTSDESDSTTDLSLDASTSKLQPTRQSTPTLDSILTKPPIGDRLPSPVPSYSQFNAYLRHQSRPLPKFTVVKPYTRSNTAPIQNLIKLVDSGTQTTNATPPPSSPDDRALDSQESDNTASDASLDFINGPGQSQERVQTWPLSLQSVVVVTNNGINHSRNASSPDTVSAANLTNTSPTSSNTSSPHDSTFTWRSSNSRPNDRLLTGSSSTSSSHVKSLLRRHSLRLPPSRKVDVGGVALPHGTGGRLPMPRALSSSADQQTAERASQPSSGSTGRHFTNEPPIRCRSVHFSSDVTVAHTGLEPESLILSSAPLKEPAPIDSPSSWARMSLLQFKKDCFNNDDSKLPTTDRHQSMPCDEDVCELTDSADDDGSLTLTAPKYSAPFKSTLSRLAKAIASPTKSYNTTTYF